MDKKPTPVQNFPKARTQKQHMEMMLSFKVNPCKERKKKIDELHINTCFDWHPRAGDRRRSPKHYTYNIQQRCEEFHTTLYAAVAAQQGADKNSKTRAEGRCKNGDQCPNYHHKFEALYHPRFYKTNPCTFYTQKGRCTNKFCAFIHPGEEGDCPVLYETREKVKSILADCQRKLADARRAESNSKGSNAGASQHAPSSSPQNVESGFAATSSSPPTSDLQDLSPPLPLPSSQQQQHQAFAHQAKYSAFNPWARSASTTSAYTVPSSHHHGGGQHRGSPTAQLQLSSSASASSAAGSALSGHPPAGQQFYGEAHQYSGNLWAVETHRAQTPTSQQQQQRRVSPRTGGSAVGVIQPPTRADSAGHTSRASTPRHSTMPVTAAPFYPTSTLTQPRTTAPPPSFDIFQLGRSSPQSFTHGAFSPPPSDALLANDEGDDGWSNALQKHAHNGLAGKGGSEKSVPLEPFFLDSSSDPIFRPTSRHTKPALGPISPRREVLPPPSAVTLLSPIDLNSSKNEEPISPGVLRNEREREEALERQMEEWEELVEEKMWRDEAKKQHHQQFQTQQLRPDLWGVTEPVLIGFMEEEEEEKGFVREEGEGYRTMEEFLGALDLGKYVEVFERQEVDLELLRALSLNELTQNLGLPWGPAKKIVTKLQGDSASSTMGGMQHTQHAGYGIFAPFMNRTATAVTTEEDPSAFFDSDVAAQSGWGRLRSEMVDSESGALDAGIMAGRMDIPLGF